MGIFDSSKKQKAELVKLQTYVKTLETRIINDRNQALIQQGVAQNEEIQRLRDSYENLKDEKSTLVRDLGFAREHRENERRKVESLVVEITKRDEQIGKLNGLMSRFSREQIQDFSSAVEGGREGDVNEVLRDLMEVIEAQSSEIRRLEDEVKGKERAIKVAENSAAESFALVRERNGDLAQENRKIEEYEKRPVDKDVELNNMQNTLTQQREQERHSFIQHIQNMENHHTQQRKQAQASLEERLLILEQEVANAECRARTIEESAKHERAALTAKHDEKLQQFKSQMSTIAQAQDAHIEKLSQWYNAEIEQTVQKNEVEMQRMTEIYILDFGDMKSHHSEHIQRMEKQIKAVITHDDELKQDMAKQCNDQLVALTQSHEEFKENMRQEHQHEIAELEKCHAEKILQLDERHKSQQGFLEAAGDEYEREIHRTKRQLEESNARFSEYKEKLQKKTEELAELTEINDQTKLRLNQTRVQLDGETRKARLASQDKQALDQQYEFMQQQCVILQEKITAASREAKTIVQNINTPSTMPPVPPEISSSDVSITSTSESNIEHNRFIEIRRRWAERLALEEEKNSKSSFSDPFQDPEPSKILDKKDHWAELSRELHKPTSQPDRRLNPKELSNKGARRTLSGHLSSLPEHEEQRLGPATVHEPSRARGSMSSAYLRSTEETSSFYPKRPRSTQPHNESRG